MEATGLTRAVRERVPPRGIAPALLLTQVRGTVPFVFETSGPSRHRYIQVLLDADRRLGAGGTLDLDHVQYFELCLAAHHATVASFVPTDVDSQIRQKLWDPGAGDAVLMGMAGVVEASLGWDCRPVSTRWVASPLDAGMLTGHLGEWFSTAAAAYGALRRRQPAAAQAMLAMIGEQVERQAKIFVELKRMGDGIGLLTAATLIAHNLGDLDRVIDQWSLPADDPLRKSWYKGGDGPHAVELRRAGALNKACMAAHNHRHFALREPRGLRRSAALLLPVSPFLDAWGSMVGSHPALTEEDVGEVAQALVHGFERLGDTGYGRALAGIEQSFPGGMSRLAEYLPARVARVLKAGALRSSCSVPRARFEEAWARRALTFKG